MKNLFIGNHLTINQTRIVVYAFRSRSPSPLRWIRTAVQLQCTTVGLAAVHLDVLSLENLTQVSMKRHEAFATCLQLETVSSPSTCHIGVTLLTTAGKVQSAVRASWFHRVNFRLVYNEQWISSVLNHEWLLLLRQAHSAWLIANMAAQTVSCFENNNNNI